MTADDDQFRDWDAAFVLGALSPEDRRAYEDHLRTCDACRAAVGELAGMPGLLRMVPADEAMHGADDFAGGEVVQLAALAQSARRVRRRRFATLVALAAALLVVGGLAGTYLTRQPTTPPPTAGVTTTLQLEPVGAVAVTADLTLQKKGWGTRIDWSCTYPAGAWPDGDGPTYELVLVDDAGQRSVVATWTARSTAAHGLGASSSMVTEHIRRVEIRVAGSDTPLAAATT
ncbi:anti-sigma factor family protein [Cellulomonas sp. McL0617]|uniref:anti-sigma factor family protein n=1 Tax=Cellulomonas sp. McL0617 TaxID=3415675 RepID=UPI003CE8B56E